MATDSHVIFLTGVTGTLGKEIIKGLLEDPRHKLCLLIRSKPSVSAYDRAKKIFKEYGIEAHLDTRVQVMDGDITLPRLGLSEEGIKKLRSEVTEIFHIAALTALNGSKEDCFRINLGGTEEVLRLAKDLQTSGRLKRFFYFSTAFVAGSLQTYMSKEDELPKNPKHANHYEASKYAAETKVREALASGLPVTIFRPSIVVGHSQTGEVSEFNVIYPFMKLFAHGILTKLPTRPDNSFNIVPIDFVTSAALKIAKQKDSLGKTFHLVAKTPPTIGMLLKVKETEYPTLPPIEVIDPATFDRDLLEPQEQLIYDMLSPYLGYLNEHLSFETINTEKALVGTGISFPKTDYEFLKVITRYAFDVGYLLSH